MTTGAWYLVRLFIAVPAFRAIFPGTTGSVCHTVVESLDLGCLLRWDCPHASTNTTYTVQTKTQGGPWQDVPWCVWVSSRSCDVSQVFSNFGLYNMIRLGVHVDPGSTVWTRPCKFDYSDFTFSPPAVSTSLKELQLLVKVQFPCATNRRCSVERCCPITTLIDPWTTVTLHNQLNVSEYQSRTVWTQDLVSFVEFSGLSPGQNYCVVANFSFPDFSMAASPRSAPQCVETLPESGPLPGIFLGLGLVLMILFVFLTLFPWKPKRDTPPAERRAKTPAPVQDPVSLVPVDPCDIHLELSVEPPSVHSRTSTLLHPSSGDASEPGLEAAYWDSGGGPARGPDSGISIPAASQSSTETRDH